MADEKNILSLEENFEQLEQIIEQMESEDISLEDSFAAYSKGMELLKICNQQIDRVEKEVIVLSGEDEEQ
ncbi:MAG: exodeoxyribonuclease VII small subunit [Acetatifactor sp.]|jgi:exodeoxyribonuclease VII small subunit|nr:exodeoxyribonuclease VII small subunit [Acetatifactor sp.]